MKTTWARGAPLRGLVGGVTVTEQVFPPRQPMWERTMVRGGTALRHNCDEDHGSRTNSDRAWRELDGCQFCGARPPRWDYR